MDTKKKQQHQQRRLALWYWDPRSQPRGPTPAPPPPPASLWITAPPPSPTPTFSTPASRRLPATAILMCRLLPCLHPEKRVRWIRFSNCWGGAGRNWKKGPKRRPRPPETCGSILKLALVCVTLPWLGSLKEQKCLQRGETKIFQQTFGFLTGEQLRKSFACYISTSSGPVIGTLYVSTRRLAFCSDNPLSHYSALGQPEWVYYKVVVQLDQLRAVNPSANMRNPSERYIQIITAAGHEFWFMGFVSYDKALKTLTEALHHFHV